MKNTLLFKKVNTFMFWCIALVLMFIPSKGFAQLLLTEDFDYGATSGNLQNIAAPSWAVHSGTSNFVQYSRFDGLTFTGHAGSGVGGAAKLVINGVGDHNRTFASQNSGTVYMSCLLRISAAAAGSDYFIHFNSGTLNARVAVQLSGSNIRFGISKAGTPTVATTNFNLNTTYMVVVKYTFIAGPGNDTCDLWILPTFASTEALAGAPLQSTSVGTDATALNAVAIRQGTAPLATIDAFRVGKTWADIAPAASLINGGNNYNATAFSTTYGTASASQSFVVAGSLLTNDVLATAANRFEVSRSDVVSYGDTATFTAAEANAGTLSVLVRLKDNAYAGNEGAQYVVELSSSPAASVNIVTSASGNPVTPLGLTISGLSSQDKTFDGNTTATLLGAPTLNGVLFSDDVSLAGSAVANYSSAAVGGPYAITVSGFSLTGTKAANYSLSQPTVANASITPSSLADQLISFPALANVPYGTTSVSLLATSDNPGGNAITYVSSNTNVATISGSSAIIVGAGTTTITASQAGDSTHNPAIDVPQSLTVTPLGITIVGLSAQDKPYDTNTTATLTGTPVLDPAPINSDDVTISGAAVANFATANVGLQAVTVTGYTLGGTKAGNYALTQPIVANATINPLAQTITFFGTLPTLTTLTPAVTLTATASSGLPVAFESSDTNVATISGNILTIVGLGTVTITAKQAGDINYTAAPDLTQTRLVETALYLNQFTGTSACPTQGNVPTIVANMSGAIATRSTVTCALLANSFSSTTLNNTATLNNNSYIEFSATANSGYRLNLTKLSFLRSGSGTCPNQLEVRYSTDGFATSTSMNNLVLTTTASTTLTWDFADFNTAVDGTITFRVYPYGTQRADLAGGAAATSGTFRIDDVIIYGAVLLPPPTITTTTPPSVINDLSATLGGNVTNTGGSSITGNGVVIAETSLNSNPIIGGANVTDIVNGSFTTETGTFSVSSSSLTPNTQYSYAAYATNAQGTSYGSVSTFYTLAVVPTSAPTVDNETFTTLDINLGSANESNSVNTQFAIRVVSGSNTYYLQSDYTLGTSPVWQDGSTWESSATVTGLISNTSYTFDVKARNGAGIETAFGPSTTLATLEIFDANLVLTSAAPAFGNVCTTGATNFATTSFTLNGFYLDSADFSVASAAGQLSFSTSENGTYSNPLVVSHDSPTMTGQVIWVQFTPSSTGAFSGTIAITGGGLLSSFDVIATGTGINTPATVTTGAVSPINVVSATITGTASPGCSEIIASGIEYSTASDFTGAIQVTEAYPITLTTLSPNTLYYVRAFATDSSASGIAYGTSTSFTTLALTTGPIADAATSIEATSFVANWQAVTGAESYLLDVSTSPTFGISSSNPNVTVLNNTGTIGASNWIETAISQQGGGSPYLGFLSSTSTSISPILNLSNFSNISLTFKTRTFNTPTATSSNITVSVSTDGVNWISLGVNAPSSSSLTNPANAFSYNLSSYNSSTVRVRFQTLSATGTAGVGIDDIIVKGDETIITPSFIVENLQVAGLSQFVSGLSELTTYHYRVRAFSTNSTSPNSNVVSVTTAAAPPTFDSVSYVGSTVCDGANGTFDVAGLLPNVVSKIYYNIDNGATQSVLTTVADNSGAATFAIPLPLSANNTVLTITTVARADDSSSLTVESGGQVFLNFIAANVTYYSDADNDTFGNSLLSQLSCIGAPSGYVSNNTDCNPNDGSKWQFASFFVDTDGDGYTNGTASVCSGIGAPAGYSATTSGTDCNDADNTKYQTSNLFTDADGDGYTIGAATAVCYGANIPSGYAVTSLGTDCDDTSSSITTGTTFYADADNDTFGDLATTSVACTQPSGYVSNSTDCDPTDGTKWQLATFFVDADLDTYGSTATASVCSGVGAPSGYSVTNDDCDDTNALLNPTNPCPTNSIVNLTLFVQGYYDSASTMRSVKFNQDLGFPQTASTTEVEDLTIELHETTAPYAALHTTTAALNTDGTLSASFSGAPSGSFYIVVKGSNLVQTWSAEAQTVGTVALNYDFSSSSSQALGDNMIEVESGVWAFFSGDLNQDLVVDGSDSDVLLEDIANSNFGPLATDVNGDGSVDGSDSDIFFPNLENSVFANILE